MLREVARTHEVTIGGSMLIAAGSSVYNRYHLVEPDSTTHLHDKDLPTMWENAFYGPGVDDGVVETGVGRAGIAVCWELIRTQTARCSVFRTQARPRLCRSNGVVARTRWWRVSSRRIGPVADTSRA